MTSIGQPALAVLRDRVDGEVLEPGDDGYDESRTVWNGMIDREPAVVVRCTRVADVVAAVDVARENGHPLAVKGGGHHVSGAGVCDDGIQIDLGSMDQVVVDPDARTARVGAGATWGDVDRETLAYDLAVPAGQDPNIGVAGLTLGGGVGWLSREHGLTCDNLLAADVVTADGEVVRASESEHPDLFWGLRGGGGNFGIVTEFEFRLHAVEPEVLAGSLIYHMEDAQEVFQRYRSFMADAPREVRPLLGITELPAASYYPEEVHGTRVVMLVMFYGGDPEEGKAVLAPLREFGDPVSDSVRRRSYGAWQRVGESTGVARTYVRSQYLDALSEAAIETIVDHGAAAPSAGSTVFVSPRGGAETEPAPDATAYPHREECHHLLVEARWSDPGRDDEHVGWVRAFHEALRPHATGAAAVNFLTADEPADRVRAAYGDNYDRLVALKEEWDPENVFRLNQNVEPTG